MLVKTYAAAVQGINAIEVTIEVNVTAGVRFFLVGLPDNAVKESHERIFSALQYNNIPFPRKQVIINMAPADIKKEGSAYDLPLAIGILAANETIESTILDKYMIMGELSLDGSLKPVKGVLPIAILAKEKGYKGFILPEQNAHEAAVVGGIDIIAVNNITQVVSFLKNEIEIEPTVVDLEAEFSKRFSTILPPLTLEEALETTKIHSVAGKLNQGGGLITRRPFRNPHHTISDTALVGGGSNPQPGEISLAHNGVLFLDELPEFKRSVLEVLRQPLEDRKITVSRAKMTVEYPAGFMLVASMNPCPCGYYNDPNHECTCAPGVVQRYLSRISGPLLDRIDMHIEIVPVPFEKLSDNAVVESSATIRQRVIAARRIQSSRFKNEKGVYCNAQMSSKMIRKYCVLDSASSQLLGKAMVKYNLSARAYDRILKLSRTIADLEGAKDIALSHVAEAINYRNLDKEGWAG